MPPSSTLEDTTLEDTTLKEPVTVVGAVRGSTLSSKGQVTIPISIRQRLGIKGGDRVDFVVQEDGRVVVRPAMPEENPFLKFVGAAPYFNSVDEIVRYYRELRDGDECGEAAGLGE